MSFDGHQTCPHCKALVQSTICGICGKSAFEAVAAPVERERRSSWETLKEDGDVARVGIGVGIVVVIVAIAAFILTRPEPAVDATELPPPDPDTVPVREPSEPEPDGPPTVDGAIPQTDVIDPGAPREVADGLSPWETAPPIDFVTGRFLDDRLDFSTDIARVAELLDAFPGDGLELTLLEPGEILTLDGSIDTEMLETTQPFAARTIVREDGVEVGELWLMASGGSAAGDDYLAAARERWNVDAAIDQFAPAPGVRMWKLGEGDGLTIWAMDLDADAIVIVQAPTLVSPEVLTDTTRAWRRNV
ncbi:MAG: hypothetical protein AAF548_14090 [Actinomycetota bacterium]